MSSDLTSSKPMTWWNPPGRTAVFLLASTSIASLLVEFYGLGAMRFYASTIFPLSCAALTAATLWDWRKNNGELARMILWGAIAGLIAAAAYDLFRVPFVYAREWGWEQWLPSLPLFKVFPRFGALILGEPLEQPYYSGAAQALGWGYHFSNGATFGVMYVAMIGDPGRRTWLWAVLMAVALELGMLFTPYPRFFGIQLTATFVVVTLTAHLVFGLALGLLLWVSTTWKLPRITHPVTL